MSDQSVPIGKLSREEAARLEIARTRVTGATAAATIAVFLTSIAAVPAVEWSGRRMGPANGDSTAWSHLSAIPSQARSQLSGLAPSARFWQWVVTANRAVLAGLSGFERGLDNESVLGQTLRPPVQAALTGWLGAGNERVYPGRDGWLFYRPDVEHVTGPGFLEPGQLRRRVVAAPEWTTPPAADPRPAISEFKRDLEARGIGLVVLPIPVKPGIHPEKLTARYANVAHAVQNPSYERFVDDLRRDGVLVFDPSDALFTPRGGALAYLDTDTHWRPEVMETIARALGAFIDARVSLPAAPDPGYRIERVEVHNHGDAARMLDLPASNRLFPPETVWLRAVRHPDGSPWRSSRDADVLVLGDSFTNIYSLESMGWGTSAGFAEQLSYTLGRPVDRLVQNDEGAFATRAILQRDPSRLDGKRIVIYQFAARELSFGDWKRMTIR